MGLSEQVRYNQEDKFSDPQRVNYCNVELTIIAYFLDPLSKAHILLDVVLIYSLRLSPWPANRVRIVDIEGVSVGIRLLRLYLDTAVTRMMVEKEPANYSKQQVASWQHIWLNHKGLFELIRGALIILRTIDGDLRYLLHVECSEPQTTDHSQNGLLEPVVDDDDAG